MSKDAHLRAKIIWWPLIRKKNICIRIWNNRKKLPTTKEEKKVKSKKKDAPGAQDADAS